MLLTLDEPKLNKNYPFTGALIYCYATEHGSHLAWSLERARTSAMGWVGTRIMTRQAPYNF